MRLLKIAEMSYVVGKIRLGEPQKLDQNIGAQNREKALDTVIWIISKSTRNLWR